MGSKIASRFLAMGVLFMNSLVMRHMISSMGLDMTPFDPGTLTVQASDY
jgi:regulator of sirC expression with transglutaminase-like and TPR domain